MIWSRVLGVVFGVCALAAGAAASPTGYVYVLEPTTGCNSCQPKLLVFDGGTTRLVTSIPLQSGKIPVGIAISPDGAHLYVSEYTPSTMTVFDARRHVKLATYTLPNVAGQLAVAADDSAVYVRVGTLLSRFDTASHTITATVNIPNGGGVGFDPTLNAVLVPDYGTGTGPGAVVAYDPVTLAEVQRQALTTSATGLSVSPGSARIHVVRERPAFGSPMSLTTLATGSLAVLRDVELGVPAGGLAPAYASTRATVYAGGHAVFEVPDGGSAVPFDLPGTSIATALALPPMQKHLFFTSVASDATGIYGVATMDLDTRQFTPIHAFAQPPGIDLMRSTPPGVSSCTYSLDQAYASFVQTPSDPASIQLTTQCAWSASSDASWVHLSATFGASGTTILVTADPNPLAENRRATVIIGGQVLTVTQAGASSAAPFGSFDTPLDNATGINGAVAVTGWALDDVAVARVRIYRDPVPGEPQTLIPLGDATFVDGARPDVAALFPTLPFASRAGWGYQLLTNMLPGGGNGTFRLHAYAEDVDGHATLLGARTITVDNGSAALPFGTLDTPGQGETVSGVITNWGWALSPGAMIPVDGSTIDVLIDGVVAGHPTYGLDRSDIAALFPGYPNTNSAVGYFVIDTTTLTNGVHTIAWVVRDSLGRAQGIGSRYFRVNNQ